MSRAVSIRILSASTLALVAIALVATQVTAQVPDYARPRQVYAALAIQQHETMTVGGGTIELTFADGAPGLDRERVRAWVRKGAEATTTYFGRFPVAKVGLLIVATDGDRVGGGTAFGFGTSAIRLNVGRETSDATFARDWRIAHELIHLALPIVEEGNWWALEGNATYVEPVARAQAGQIPASQMWTENIRDMPKGLPLPGEGGLDGTERHDRIYWGGAIFWLVADVMIRDATHNTRGAQDALRGINRQSGGNTARWSLAKVMAVGDAATGTQVLTRLYAEMGSKPVATDLDALFKRLGVRRDGDTLVADDAAPQAAVRQAITRAPR